MILKIPEEAFLILSEGLKKIPGSGSRPWLLEIVDTRGTLIETYDIRLARPYTGDPVQQPDNEDEKGKENGNQRI